ncbi:hypothetical protein JAAARDRAFT_683621 [Jaapia argillacea MUCL 33604]|uniref:Uncharacterized protein n=1 Tax=Jaapia argillacea MUCL 33604 TaxID=933084 RepID=A0A067QLK9_9AGAM|nr:hypothetical protein JAAARDRAFT_683621 [Jaapia argillacea MUCL 33604]
MNPLNTTRLPGKHRGGPHCPRYPLPKSLECQKPISSVRSTISELSAQAAMWFGGDNWALAVLTDKTERAVIIWNTRDVATNNMARGIRSGVDHAGGLLSATLSSASWLGANIFAITSSQTDTYTYFTREIFISERAKQLLEDLLKKADDRDPARLISTFTMSNIDFFNYALLDLVDKTLSTIHTKIIKKENDEAMYLLEALTVFMNLESSWPDTILKLAAEWGHAMASMSCDSPYYFVCKGIGKRLFKGKSDEVKALEESRLEEWIQSLDAKNQKAVREAIKEDEEEDAELAAEGKPTKTWYSGKADEEDDDDYRLTRIWKEYKDYLSGVPTKPLRGPPKWDISKWSQAEKAAFSLDRFGGDDSGEDDGVFF